MARRIGRRPRVHPARSDHGGSNFQRLADQLAAGYGRLIANARRGRTAHPAGAGGHATQREHYAQGDTAFLAGDRLEVIFAGTVNGLATGIEDASLAKFGSLHQGVVQFVYLDGHVEAIQDQVDIEVLKAASTIAGGELAAN